MEDGYSICFNKWALDKDIKNELGLLLIISSLCAERGYCFASNSYLAKLFNTNESTISRKIGILESKGYIQIEYKKRGSEVIERNIRLSNLITDRYQKWQPTVIKNDKDNNISNNNTSNNIIREKTKFIKPTLEEIKTYIEEKNLNVNADDFYQYFEEGNWIDSKGNKVKNWKQKLLTWNKYKTNTKVTPKQSFNQEIDKSVLDSLYDNM